VEEVDFTNNDSILYNEVIAHRLALIPLVFEADKFHFKEEKHEGEKSCQFCEVVFSISKKAPGMIYAKDMKSSNPDVKPLFPDTPIIELFGEEKLKLEATARLGYGKQHAKFKAAVTNYRYLDDSGTKFEFNVESVSGLNAEEIVMSSIEILKQKLKEFDKQLKKI
jgi:DNA-directed RNA polymerase subunit D